MFIDELTQRTKPQLLTQVLRDCEKYGEFTFFFRKIFILAENSQLRSSQPRKARER